MDDKIRDALWALLVMVALIAVGSVFIDRSIFGYTESAILYLAAVVGAGLFWIGWRK